MYKKYQHIFFDLDHTLWDFEKNSIETLEHLYHHYKLHIWGIETPAAFIDTYSRINHQMWDAYTKGEINKETLRVERFTRSLIELGMPPTEIPEGIWQLYLDICPTKTNLFPNALETLEYLGQNYTLSIITNGFEQTQQRKIEHSGIARFIKHLVTSEKVGFAKPDPRLFIHVLEMNKAQAHQAIMIGDNIETDIGGAKGSGIDHIFFNPEKTVHSHLVQHEIHALQQLKDIL